MKLTSLLTLLLLTSSIFAQEEGSDTAWTKGAVTTITFSQVALQNWASGGENSVTGVGFLNAFANYKEGNCSWDNTLNLGYGVLKQNGGDWYKNDDKLEFASKYGQLAADHWYYTALIDFKSQFSKGYTSIGDTEHSSTFFAPAYLNVALGIDYQPNDNFTLFISPATAKMTFVTDTMLSNAGSYGVDAGKEFRFEGGAYVKVAYRTEILENIHFETKLDLFSNYAEKPQNIDVNWDNLLTFKVNKYINASLMFNMVYDDDTKFAVGEDNDGDGIADRSVAKLQWKEMFGLGFSYSL